MEIATTLALFDIEDGVRDLLAQHGLAAEWRFAWDRAVRRAGKCDHRRKIISLSRPIFSHTPELDWRQTALHEIAHALCGPGNGHNERWRHIARRIGAKPERCHSLPTPPTGIVGYCACDTPHKRVRMPRATYLCRRCRVRIVWTRKDTP